MEEKKRIKRNYDNDGSENLLGNKRKKIKSKKFLEYEKILENMVEFQEDRFKKIGKKKRRDDDEPWIMGDLYMLTSFIWRKF
jgi:hypothetical protein